MRIAYVITRSDSVGGAHVHVRDLSRELLRRGHEVRVFVGGNGVFASQLREVGVEVTSVRNLVRRIHPMLDLLALLELRRGLKSFAPDLVSTHSSKAGWLGRIAARGLGVPVLFTAHGWAFTEGVPMFQRSLYRMAERLAAPLASRIITVSDYDRVLAMTAGVGAPQQVVTVHNGMPETKWRAAAANSSGTTQLIMVARFDEQKDFHTLLKALAILSTRAWSIELVGDGPSQTAVQSLAQQLGISKQIVFAGVSTNVAERLAAAHVFILTSHWEGLPRSIIEAMRAGLPVIASDVGGVNELVEDGRTGFLVHRRDHEGLARRLDQLITSPQLRGQLGAAGRQSYERHFTFERMVSETLGVYSRLGLSVSD